MSDVSNSFSAWETLPEDEPPLCIAVRRPVSPPRHYEAESDRNLAAVFQANAISFLYFEAAFDSPHRGLLLNALLTDGVPGTFVRLLDDKNQGTTAAVRTPAGCTIPFEVVTGVR
ncbi:hypothetical protein RB195_015336 [Necator americanus]|uniref:Uncharacterized protein n=1 Tax=Necator americanus TaxID=51031 RepID=A0ABR1E6Q9_NECAM